MEEDYIDVEDYIDDTEDSDYEFEYESHIDEYSYVEPDDCTVLDQDGLPLYC